MSLILRYRIRIDEKGVWRRRFVHWDLWPWDAFEAGKIRHGKLGDQLTYPEKNWYWRTISASVLGKADRAAFEAVVAHYRTLPPPPELPDTLLIKHGIGRRLGFSAEGLRLEKHGEEPHSVAWGEVVRVEIQRASHDRPDFATLNLHLANQSSPVCLRQRNGTSYWNGATGEEIVWFIQSYVDASRIEITALRGRPVDLAELSRRLALIDQGDGQLRKLRRIGWYMYVIGVTVMTAVVVEPWNRPNPLNWRQNEWIHTAITFAGFAVLLGLQVGMIFGVVYFKRRELREFRAELLKWKPELE
jgi:hypothetical protein